MRIKRESGLFLAGSWAACPLCGTRIASGAMFCPRCGRSGRLRFDPAAVREARREVRFPRRLPR
ncbi:MAG: zinc ribbon domain-containing protein [Actinobacteria bacterium]|nr:zinc ribbon domain-containing protein [Actinomycetota bacterium]